MSVVAVLLARYELWIYGVLGAAALFFLASFWSAYQHYERTPFGLEKDAARRRQNGALAALMSMLVLGGALFVFNRYLVFSLDAAAATPGPGDARPTAAPTATLIRGGGPLVVDSSGCDNPGVTLLKPGPGERIAGSYEIVGTASIANFAFYKVEISGAATNGAWVTLAVGNVPQVEGPLGTFDTSPYQPGEYAFRLVVTNNVGEEAAPCVIAVTLAPGIEAPSPAP